MTREWLTSAENQQLDITAKDAVRLQREVPATTEKADLRQKFEVATSKATVGVIYTRPVEKPVFTTVGCPPWLNRLRKDLERDNSTYLQPLQTTNRLNRQRPGSV